MNVETLIEILKQLNPKDEVKAFNADTGQPESVTGMTHGGKDGIVELFTDEID